MSKNTTTEKVRETIRSRLVKQGRRGMSLEALTNHAQSVKRSYNTSHVKAVLRSLNAEEVNEGVYAVPANR